MASITLAGKTIETIGTLPDVGAKAPEFQLLRTDLKRATLGDFPGKKILSIYPSVDTGVCAASVRKFNKLASDRGLTVLNISEDLPFALKRFCGAEGIERVETLSGFRSSFGKDYGVEITTGAMSGLMSRAILVLDADELIVYGEQVPEIGQEPNYDAALAAL